MQEAVETTKFSRTNPIPIINIKKDTSEHVIKIRFAVLSLFDGRMRVLGSSFAPLSSVGASLSLSFTFKRSVELVL